ncbi:hypothetical protein POUND7_015361 [Theobroma cacao]
MHKTVQLVRSLYTFFVLIGSLALLTRVGGDPRAQTLNITCGNQMEHNTTIFVPNFVATMEKISEQMRDSGFGTAVTGSGPDANHGLAQCYGDLSLLDCVLCYAEARTVLPQCYPHNGGRIFLDGCFMRSENYTFFEEYTGPDDRAVCGNTSRKGSNFQDSARQAVNHAVAAALEKEGYAKAQVAVPGTNESAYVLVNCWRTLNKSSCKACLENASASILGCLPWSEGRALNTGCFVRYSDTNFLNKEPGNGISKGTIIIIVVSVVSSLVVLAIGVAIGVYIRKHRYIQKKRRGKSFIYKGILPDGREIAVKRLFFNNRHRAADFYNEVNIISSVEHKNLVRLLGCSCAGPESLLVYEFLPNKSLDRFIFVSLKYALLYPVEAPLQLKLISLSNVKNEIFRVVHIGLLCAQEIPSLRPSMSKVLQMLTKKDEDLPAPTNPPFMDEKTMEFNDTSENPGYPFNAADTDSIATVTHSSFYAR